MPSALCQLLLLSGSYALTIGAAVPLSTSRAGSIKQQEVSPQASLAPTLTGAAALLSFEQIATMPKPGSTPLSMLNFSPDDRYVTYLGVPPGAASLTQQLFAYDRTTGETKQVIGSGAGEESFSKEEKLRRERQRIMSVGVTEYSWATKADLILIPKDGALYVQDGVGEGASATLRRLFDPADPKWADVGSGALLDAKLADDGTRVYFVWENEVCSCDVAAAADGATPKRHTTGARGQGVTNGLADYCAQEEMDRYTGFWPSPAASGLVAFEEVDERHIPLFQIMNQGGARAGPLPPLPPQSAPTRRLLVPSLTTCVACACVQCALLCVGGSRRPACPERGASVSLRRRPQPQGAPRSGGGGRAAGK